MYSGGVNGSESRGACSRGEKEPVDPWEDDQDEAADIVAFWRTGDIWTVHNVLPYHHETILCSTLIWSMPLLCPFDNLSLFTELWAHYIQGLYPDDVQPLRA